jgi:hypothetical protein
VLVGWRDARPRRPTNRQIGDATTTRSEWNQLDHAHGGLLR